MRDPHIEPAPLGLGFAHDVRLKRREIVRQPRHRRRHRPRMLDLGQQKIDRHRQPRRRKNLLPQIRQQLLHRHILRQPLAQRAEEMGLFDVFFAVEHEAGLGNRGSGVAGRVPVGQRCLSSIIPACPTSRPSKPLWMPSPGARSSSSSMRKTAKTRGISSARPKRPRRSWSTSFSAAAGQFCTPLLPEVARRLELAPVVETNTAPLGTGFLTPIDHRLRQNGHHGRRAGSHRPGDRRSSYHGSRLRPARARPSAAGQRRGRAAPGGAYRGDRRSVPHGGARPGAACCAKFLTTAANGPRASSCRCWPPSTT